MSLLSQHRHTMVIKKRGVGRGWLTWRSGSVCGNAPNTGGSESGPLPLRDKHHTPPSHWQALPLSTECTFVAFFLRNRTVWVNKKYKMQSESRGVSRPHLVSASRCVCGRRGAGETRGRERGEEGRDVCDGVTGACVCLQWLSRSWLWNDWLINADVWHLNAAKLYHAMMRTEKSNICRHFYVTGVKSYMKYHIYFKYHCSDEIVSALLWPCSWIITC